MTDFKIELPSEKGCSQDPNVLNKPTFKPKMVQKEEFSELKKIDLGKNVYLRVLQNSDGKFIDIRRFYKGYPTKRGVRFTQDMFDLIKTTLNE